MFRTLLVPLDGSESSEGSLPLARGIAAAASSTIHLAQVQTSIIPGPLLSSTQFDYQGFDMEAYTERNREDIQRHLTTIATALEADGIAAQPAALDGHVVDALTEHAASIEADLIVMTTHGRSGASRMWLGSIAEGLVRHVNVPIVLLRTVEEQDTPIRVEAVRHILIPLDGSDLGESILAPAAALARLCGARLTLAHVVAMHSALDAGVVRLLPENVVRIRDEAHAYLEAVADRLRAEGLTVETHVADGYGAAAAIVALGEELGADLIALATHGHGGVRRAVIGSVADKVLRSSSHPLMIVRGEPDGAED